MIEIRPYKKSDWPQVLSWWEASGEVIPLESMMPMNSSFIAEIEGEPALAVTIYLTNTPAVCYVENFVGNPLFKGSLRRHASAKLSKHIAEFAKSLGYERLLCMTEKDVLKNHYFELGFDPVLHNVTTLVRSL